MQNFNHFIPTKLFFGCGSISNLATTPLPGKKALIVISAGTSMRKYGYLETVVNAVAKNGAESVVYDKILPNPIKTHVMEAAEICRKEGCDFVIGLGGGSSIDSAKSIAVMACNEGDYWDYISGGTGKGKSIKRALPVIAIPTTAGTGTEMDPWTVITNNNEKIGYGNEHTFPVFSIVDPELMVSVPAHLTAYQGFDAFFHASEGFMANIANPTSRLYSLKSIELLYKFLPAAVADGNDMEARTNVALASTLAGMVESTSSCTSEHSLEHAMSAFYPALPHGAGLISLSLAYFAAFMKDVPELFIEMAEVMTGKKSTDPADFITALATMQKACKVDNIKLSEYGIIEGDLVKFVQNARATMGGLFSFDPHPLSDEEILSIYKQSYK
ncbi:iron-containing alcohol dehydrogenase [uncultured Bacteroides sp.]|uniref:iron-containing alcohol dehydrogenase n=1 Tax=uncultured Bacteroides sp. TaxID=162156 RepID=UPI002AA5E450|nr:iron-containing alcohol dehydrogenase [uncultured Bacteroides sp.]